MKDKLPPSLDRFAGELERAIGRELRSRRARRLARVPRPRPRLLAGTTVGAAATATVLALVLSAAGSPPAFAVTRNGDGSYFVTLRSLSAIPAANTKLARMGVPARFRQLPANRLPGSCIGAGNARSVAASGAGTGQNNILIPAHARSIVIAAWRDKHQVRVAEVRVQKPGTAGSLVNSGNSAAVYGTNTGTETTPSPITTTARSNRFWCAASGTANSGNAANNSSRDSGQS